MMDLFKAIDFISKARVIDENGKDITKKQRKYLKRGK